MRIVTCLGANTERDALFAARLPHDWNQHCFNCAAFALAFLHHPVLYEPPVGEATFESQVANRRWAPVAHIAPVM